VCSSDLGGGPVWCDSGRTLLTQVNDMDLDLWTEAHLNPDGTKNKFNTAYKDMPREGFVGLQNHGQQVQFRNLRIKPLGSN